MSTTYIADAFPRISARRGQVADLNVDFYRNGELSDPYAIRHIEIYKTAVAPHNLLATVPLVSPDDQLYPSPVVQETIGSNTSALAVGKYHLPYAIPDDFPVPDVYFDVWYYYSVAATDSGYTQTNGFAMTDYKLFVLDLSR